MARPIVALLTDFGTQDYYVGAMKGAVLAACREATLVDITHEIPAHDIVAAAYTLASAVRAFPGETVFLAVVDPGVGSERRAIALEADGYRFVGPDNGLFSDVLAAHVDVRVHEITNRGLFRYDVSATFHGRDIFGPIAGLLAGGTPIDQVGSPIPDPVRLERQPARAVADGVWETTVVHVDRFGNLTTGLSRSGLDRILTNVEGDPTGIVILVEGVVLPFVRTYSDVPEGDACALLGSSDRLEVAVHRGSAARLLGAVAGTPVRVKTVSATG
jgi:S-adenosylmethionine hydrolase